MVRLSRFATALSLIFVATISVAPAAQATTTANTAWVTTWNDVSPGDPIEKNSVQLVNLDDGTVLDRIEMPEVRPAELAYSESTGKLWVLSQPWNYGDSSIAVVDTTDGSYDAAVMTANTALTGPDNVMQYSMVGSWIGDIAVSPDGSKIFVSGIDFYNNTGAILVYNADTEELLGEVPLTGSEPEAMTINAWANELYVKTKNANNDETYIETINMGATSWATARTHVSTPLDWGTDGCGGQSSLDYDYNRGYVFGVCWQAHGFTTWSPSTNISTFHEVSELDSTIGVDVSEDGTRIAFGTCYVRSFVATLAADGTPSNVIHAGPDADSTAKPVKFFGPQNRLVTGAWDGFLSFFEDGNATPANVDLLGTDSDPTNNNAMYVGSIVLTHEVVPPLAETGFEIAPLGLAGFSAIAIGAAVAFRRRQWA